MLPIGTANFCLPINAPHRCSQGVQYAGVANRVVRAAFRDAGFRVVKGNNWNVLWGAAMAPDEYKARAGCWGTASVLLLPL